MNNYKFKIFFAVSGVVTFLCVFFCNPPAVINGVSKGLSLCGSAVIPPLFPFILLSDFLIRSGLCDIFGAFLAPITKLLFKLPGAAGCAVLMSLIGGYPVGAKMTAELINNGSISEKQGRRMMLFCVNAGPAFVIGTVGSVLFSSKKAGVILYVSMVISALFIGIFMRFFTDEETVFKKKKTEFNPNVITDSIAASTNSMIIMCAWVLAFSCVNSIVAMLPLKEKTLVWMSVLTEVAGGCSAAVNVFPVSIQALVMGWAGLSVHCQIYPFIKVSKLKITHFFLSRLAHGGIATMIAAALFQKFPCEVSVFSSDSDILPQVFSVSAPAAVAMLCLASFLILDILPGGTRRGINEK